LALDVLVSAGHGIGLRVGCCC